MPNPQEPSLARSRTVGALDPDATESQIEADGQPDLDADESNGPVPPENQPNHDHDSPDQIVES